MTMQRTSCESWYFVRVFGYKDTELIMPKLVLCIGFWIRGCRAHPAKVGTLPGFLDTKMHSLSCQSWYFFWGFGYDGAELILSKLVHCLSFWIKGCRAHPTTFGWYFVWIFGYKYEKFILPKLHCLGFWI